ncbi:MAG: LysE family translocator [Desulfobacterales bacterium]|nr:LysE family translocator [Desulfobacterales bacterium]
MGLHSWWIYLSLVFVATATPGPAVLFIVTIASLHGWQRAVFAALGNILGLFCLGIVAVTGLGTLLAASKLLFDLVRYAGALYLFYMGVRLLFQRGMSPSIPQGEVCALELSGWRVLVQAFGVAVSNPKAIVFLTALFPQFIQAQAPLVPQFSLLIAVLMCFSFFFLMAYGILAHRARSWFVRPGRGRWIQRISGSAFIGFSLLLATSSRR